MQESAFESLPVFSMVSMPFSILNGHDFPLQIIHAQDPASEIWGGMDRVNINAQHTRMSGVLDDLAEKI